MCVSVFMYVFMDAWMYISIYSKGIDEIGISFTIVVLIVQRLQNVCKQSFVMFLDC